MFIDDFFYSYEHLSMLNASASQDDKHKIISRIEALKLISHVVHSREMVQNIIQETNISDCLIKLNPTYLKHTALMICKNEESSIEKNLLPLINNFDQVIVVDTGSSDTTVDILMSLAELKNNLLVKKFEWCDDFSVARNFALSFIDSGWCCFFDADEFIDDCEIHNLFFILSHLYHYEHIRNAYLCPLIINGNNTVSRYVGRFFLRESGIVYQGKIHEELHKNDNVRLVQVSINIKIFHSGYDEGVRNKKLLRDLRLLLLAISEENESIKYKFYYARENLLYRYDEKSLSDALTTLELCSEPGYENYEFTLLISILIMLYRHNNMGGAKFSFQKTLRIIFQQY